jgi:hypothetical protein
MSYPLKSEAYVTTVASVRDPLTVIREINQPCIGLLSIQTRAVRSLSATEEREYELKVSRTIPGTLFNTVSVLRYREDCNNGSVVSSLMLPRMYATTKLGRSW